MKVKAGQTWFVKRPGAMTLIKCKITSVTNHTIEVLVVADYKTWPERYKKDEIELVEQCEMRESMNCTP